MMSETVFIGNDLCPHCSARHPSNYDCRAITHSLLPTPETPKALTDIQKRHADCYNDLGAYTPLVHSDIGFLLSTIATQAKALAESSEEFRKVELLWKQVSVEAVDWKQRHEATDTLWDQSIKRVNELEAALAEARNDALDEAGITSDAQADADTRIADAAKAKGDDMKERMFRIAASTGGMISKTIRALKTPTPTGAT